MGASPVPPKRRKAEPAQPPNASPPYHHGIFVDSGPPPNPCHSDEARSAKEESAVSRLRKSCRHRASTPVSFCRYSLRPKPKFALLQTRSGERMQPTAQAVGSCRHVAPARRGERNARIICSTSGIKRVTIRKLPPTPQNRPQSPQSIH
jgi:hypothetical protein